MTTHTTLDADYLVVGTGAVGMAFVDTMLTESDATFVMVDRHHMPGGHWNDAYPFVRLHQPSAFYGVNSRDLGSNRIDESGANKGFYELASGAEVSAYFEQVMRETFLPSGRVQYFPMCDYTGDGQFRALLSDDTYSVNIAKKTVDSTFFQTSVPSTHTRKFAVESGVACIPPNDLPVTASKHTHFAILGGGKTAMDVGVWLLANGAAPDAITWVVPRDSWLLNRASTQPGAEFFGASVGGFTKQLEAMRDGTSVEDVFLKLEQSEQVFRIDQSQQPTMFHYATISAGEVDELRRITQVIRGRRVEQITASDMTLSDGERVAMPANTLFIDCTASAVPFREIEPVPIFSEDLITIQTVRTPLVTFSAALIAFVEAHYDDLDEQNRLCTAVDLSDTPAEWLRAFAGNMMNQNTWGSDPKVRDWLASIRLDPFGSMIRESAGASPANQAIMGRMVEAAIPAVMNIQKLTAADA